MPDERFPTVAELVKERDGAVEQNDDRPGFWHPPTGRTPLTGYVALVCPWCRGGMVEARGRATCTRCGYSRSRK